MNFFKKHKVLTAVLLVAIVIISVALTAVSHFLNKINYDVGDSSLETAPVSQESSEDFDILNSGSLSADEKDSLSSADNSIEKNLDDSQLWYSDDVINILLMGIDYGGKSYPYGRSDAMLVLSINKSTKKIILASFSRAAYVAIPGYNNTRLNHAHGYGGASLAIATFEKNYKIRIDNYVSVTFAGFEKIIDAFGGVRIALTSAEAKTLNQQFGKFPSSGTYDLDGKEALAYSRTRKIDTDRDRTGRQRKVLLSLAEKAKAMNVSGTIGMLNTVLPLVTTDLKKSEIVRQAASAYSYLSWGVEQYIIPHKSSSLVLRDGFEVVLVDWQDEVKYVHNLFYKGSEVKYEAA